MVVNVLSQYRVIDASDWTPIKNRIKDDLHRYLFECIKRNPMILPIIMDT